MKLTNLFESQYSSEVIVDDELFNIALNDTKNSNGPWMDNILWDVQRVIIGSDKSFDRDVKIGRYTLDDVAKDWKSTRDFIRLRHDNPVILYRADLPATEHNTEALTLFYGDKKLASRFMTDNRTLIEQNVKIDDIIALYAHNNGYYEFIVKI